jgi:hypothetical protein
MCDSLKVFFLREVLTFSLVAYSLCSFLFDFGSATFSFPNVNKKQTGVHDSVIKITPKKC